MIRLISIHIPKTAGTSFHEVLSSVYGDRVSPTLRRRDVPEISEGGKVSDLKLPQEWTVLHGHLRYGEITDLHQQHTSDILCWLRHPADRVISNHAFFIDRLGHPEINPEVSALNAHRRKESLLEYASLPENRNRMSWFLEGTTLDSFLFIGFQENFSEDLSVLAQRLGWSGIKVPRLNERKAERIIDPDLFEEICSLNDADMALYREAMLIRAKGHFKKALP